MLFQVFSLSSDRPHLKKHLYEAVELMEFSEKIKMSILLSHSLFLNNKLIFARLLSCAENFSSLT